MLIDRLALGFGLVLGPLFAWWQVGLDLMWSGIVGGTAAYLIHRFARGAAMSALSAEYVAWLALIVAGFLPNEAWRWLGVVFARGLDEDSEIVVWVRAVATAILAGVIAKLTIFAPGVLATVPTPVRLAAVAIGFAAFVPIRRSVLAGVLAGEAGADRGRADFRKIATGRLTDRWVSRVNPRLAPVHL